jgi:hypothetical protein
MFSLAFQDHRLYKFTVQLGCEFFRCIPPRISDSDGDAESQRITSRVYSADASYCASSVRV